MSTAVEERIKAKLGPALADSYAKIMNDPELKELIIENVTPLLDVDDATKTLKEVCEGKALPQKAVGALKVLDLGLFRPLGLRVQSRPMVGADIRGEGLVAALRQAVTLKATHPVTLAALRVDKAGSGRVRVRALALGYPARSWVSRAAFASSRWPKL